MFIYFIIYLESKLPKIPIIISSLGSISIFIREMGSFLRNYVKLWFQKLITYRHDML